MHIIVSIPIKSITKYFYLSVRFIWVNMPNQRFSIIAVVKLTQNCNLSCKYCYYNAGKERSMEIETAIRIIDEIANAYKKCTFILHGGEPILWGIENIKFVTNYAKKYKKICKFDFKLQTNGTLLTQKILMELTNLGIKFGISIDGPPDIQDKIRPLKNGGSSSELLMKGIKIANSMDLKLASISVISTENVDRINEVYNFLKKLNIRSQRYLPLATIGRGKYCDKLSISGKDYGKAMIKLFEAWKDDTEIVNIVEFKHIIKALYNNSGRLCIFSPNCWQKVLGFDTNGDIYSCGRGIGNKILKHGNIYTRSLQEIITSKEFKHKTTIFVPIECVDCKWFKYCHGGCPLNEDMEDLKNIEKDVFCEAYKLLFERIEKELYG